jgi:hypothetical protein
MAETQYDPEIKFMIGEDKAKTVTLLFDDCLDKIGKYGPFKKYTVSENDIQCTFIASDGLHDQLKWYNKGSVLKITKIEYEPEKTKFVVTGINGTNTIDPENPPNKAQNTPLNAVPKLNPIPTIDDRTHDIHRQVAFKEACKMFGSTDETLSDDQLFIIKANTDSLLANVLEYLAPIIDDDDVPF